MGERTAEFVLGLIGGIFGIISGIIALAIGGVGAVVGGEGASSVVGLGFLAILFSVLGIVGASLVNSKTKLAGWFMVIAAVGGVISISAFYALSFILLITAGLLALIRKTGGKK